MTCPNCGKEYAYGSTCPFCKMDTVLYSGAVRISDALYNKALAKIKVSDLSGAIDGLSKSISINKHNTQARNLLGLVQYEVGHVGEALKNWVISCNLQKDQNAATGYIETIQKNARGLERLNDAIRIFNQALNDIWQKSDDMAIIKLKQAVDLNPKFIDALNLLTFCYMIQKDKARAIAMSERVLSIDAGNTVALNYFNELNPGGKASSRNVLARKRSPQQPTSAEAPEQQIIAPYKRVTLHERRNVNFHIEGILALVVGIVCTLGVMYVLVFPALDRTRETQMEDMQSRLYAAEQAFEETIGEMEEEISLHQSTISRLEDEVNHWALRYDAQDRTFQILHAFEFLRDGRLREAVDALGGVDISGLPTDIAERAQEIHAVAFPQLASQYYHEGRNAYFARPADFEKARVDLERALRYADQLQDEPLTGDILYLLAFTFSNIEIYDRAIHYFNRMEQEFPNHRYIRVAMDRRSAISD